MFMIFFYDRVDLGIRNFNVHMFMIKFFNLILVIKIKIKIIKIKNVG